MRSMLRRALPVIALIAGCAADPLAPVPFNAAAFELAGRLSVRSDGRAFASAIRWQQSAAGDEVWLNTPLGQTLAHLEDRRAGATLTTAEQKQYRAQSIESLTQSAFGWRFPLAGLRYWVLGESAPSVAAVAPARDAAGRLLRVTQAGWQVEFEYADAAAVRPARLDLTAPEAQIRLVVDRFERVAP